MIPFQQRLNFIPILFGQIKIHVQKAIESLEVNTINGRTLYRRDKVNSKYFVVLTGNRAKGTCVIPIGYQDGAYTQEKVVKN